MVKPGYKLTLEQRANQSRAKRKYWDSPESDGHRVAVGKAMKKLWDKIHAEQELDKSNSIL